ncbi:hypothetical protein RhiirC2_762618, partial [Rhizophagus irregularis]
MEQVLWPVGDSLEDMKPYKDLVVWTVEDGIVYEISKEKTIAQGRKRRTRKKN